MITLKEYLMDRDESYTLSEECLRNAADLLCRVNWLLGRLNIHTKVTSGWRPEEINKKVGGASKSAHTTCMAIDILDPFGKTATLILSRLELLEEVGLFLESPLYTKKESNGSITQWVHLQSKETKSRVFIPY
jgi:hypothetical protein